MATRTTQDLDGRRLFAGDTPFVGGHQTRADSPCTTRLRWQNGLLSQTIFNHAQHLKMKNSYGQNTPAAVALQIGDQGMHSREERFPPQFVPLAAELSMPCYPPINGLVLALSIPFGVRVSSFSVTSAALRVQSRAAAGGRRSERRGAIMSAASSSSPTFIDIGANLLDDVFQGRYHGGSQKHEPDLDAVLERASAAGVEKVHGESVASGVHLCMSTLQTATTAAYLRKSPSRNRVVSV